MGAELIRVRSPRYAPRYSPRYAPRYSPKRAARSRAEARAEIARNRYGADLAFLGAPWHHVGTRRNASVPDWDQRSAAAWSRVLGACARALRPVRGRCVLRTVLEHARQTRATAYAAFERRLTPIAAAAGVPLMPLFNATWNATRRGLFRHHDGTRIHFADAGRTWLAQMSLQAIRLLSPRPHAHIVRHAHGTQSRGARRYQPISSQWRT